MVGVGWGWEGWGVSEHSEINKCSQACIFSCLIVFDKKWLSRDRNLHGLGMSQGMTASPDPSFRALCRVGDAVCGRGYAGWTTSQGGRPCPCQNCSQGPPAEKTGRGSLLNHFSCPPKDPVSQGTELN